MERAMEKEGERYRGLRGSVLRKPKRLWRSGEAGDGWIYWTVGLGREA